MPSNQIWIDHDEDAGMRLKYYKLNESTSKDMLRERPREDINIGKFIEQTIKWQQGGLL